jgi:hypothetical protein
MAFNDWLRETARRYQHDSIRRATDESMRALVRGACRRAGAHIGTPIWRRGDWDVLIILDACRHDLWTETALEYNLPRGGSGVWSNASCSIDWITRNFNQHPNETADVGYLSANPFADHDADHAQSADLRDNESLAHFRPLYETEWSEINTDPPIETVPPARVTDHAIDAWRRCHEHGIDRMVVHYMQPHEPYIARPKWSYQDPKDNPVLKNLVTGDYPAGSSPWQAMVSSGEVTPAEFWPVYQDNLRWVLDDVTERLIRNLDANTVVISSDHGNGLGEWGEWHHPPGGITPAVRKVPWVEVPARDTKSVDPIVERQAGASVDEQLTALGYL